VRSVIGREPSLFVLMLEVGHSACCGSPRCGKRFWADQWIWQKREIVGWECCFPRPIFRSAELVHRFGRLVIPRSVSGLLPWCAAIQLKSTRLAVIVGAEGLVSPCCSKFRRLCVSEGRHGCSTKALFAQGGEIAFVVWVTPRCFRQFPVVQRWWVPVRLISLNVPVRRGPGVTPPVTNLVWAFGRVHTPIGKVLLFALLDLSYEFLLGCA